MTLIHVWYWLLGWFTLMVWVELSSTTCFSFYFVDSSFSSLPSFLLLNKFTSTVYFRLMPGFTLNSQDTLSKLFWFSLWMQSILCTYKDIFWTYKCFLASLVQIVPIYQRRAFLFPLSSFKAQKTMACVLLVQICFAKCHSQWESVPIFLNLFGFKLLFWWQVGLTKLYSSTWIYFDVCWHWYLEGLRIKCRISTLTISKGYLWFCLCFLYFPDRLHTYIGWVSVGRIWNQAPEWMLKASIKRSTKMTSTLSLLSPKRYFFLQHAKRSIGCKSRAHSLASLSYLQLLKSQGWEFYNAIGHHFCHRKKRGGIGSLEFAIRSPLLVVAFCLATSNPLSSTFWSHVITLKSASYCQQYQYLSKSSNNEFSL